MKVFAVLLLFAASCELVANPSEGLKDLLHKLAVKNSGNRTRLSSQSYKATSLTFWFSWLPLNKDIFRSQESSCCPEHYWDKIWGWAEGCKQRWMEHWPSFLSHVRSTLEFYGVHFHLVLHLPVTYQMTTSHLPGFLKWFCYGIYFLFPIQIIHEQRMGFEAQEIRFGS